MTATALGTARTSPPAIRRRRGILAGITALALTGAGMLGITAPAAADPTIAAPNATACEPTNPMGGATPIGSTAGYTVFVRSSAILANSELEGTLAVGGKATFGDPRGEQGAMYPILHGGAGGSADYDVPTIDGEPNRVLIGEFASVGKVVQVKTQGASGTNATAGVKIENHQAPAGYTFGPAFGHSGTTFFPSAGGNQSPQIDSQSQQWNDLATAQQSWGMNGTVLSHFPTDTGAEQISGFTDWIPVAPPAGNDQPVTLQPGGPSKLTLADFDGVQKFTLDGYSEDSFLVITVKQSDVIGGRVTVPTYGYSGIDSAHNAGISHILYDFSAVTGDVEVIAKTDSVRGSIYAPNAHVIFPSRDAGGQQFEGQVIANDFTALQGSYELHTNLFKGRFPCEDVPTPVDEGTFSLAKKLSGITANDFPAGTTFPVTATWNGGTRTYNLPADGTTVPAGVTLPAGTVVTLTEGDLPTAPTGYTFVSHELSADTITILENDEPNITWHVTNTYEEDSPAVRAGGFTLQKELVGVSQRQLPKGLGFTVVASWVTDGVPHMREFTVPADGTIVSGAQNLRSGTVVTFSEIRVPTIEGFTFDHASFTAERLVVGADTTTAVRVTNTYTPEPEKPVTPVDPTEPTKPTAPTTPTKPTKPTGPTQPALPNTGGGDSIAVVIAASVLLLGGAAVLIRRRRVN
ncbi:collagen-binding domain-containing protein [Leucobacter sp. 1207-22]|uniref:collagen-binding domain-containing protein n=1 Tax=Leucobacter sp. 1207-22 TaxID=2604456 RepID=UPI004062B681